MDTGVRGDAMAPAGRVLIVDDEVNMQIVLSAAFEDAGFATSTASTGAEAIECFTEADFDLMLLDLKLPDMTGIDVFRRAREVRPGIIVIMITAYSSVETAIQAMKMGAYDYITKPFNVEKLLMVAGNAIEARHRMSRCSGLRPGPLDAATWGGAADSGGGRGSAALSNSSGPPASARRVPEAACSGVGHQVDSAAGGSDAAGAGSVAGSEGAAGIEGDAGIDMGKAARAMSGVNWAHSGIDLRAEDEDFAGVVGVTAQMRRLMEMSRDIAPTNATVLIYGESGTGKELVADYIHKKSLRAGRSFIKVNCAAIPEPLLESELFGHEKGAFTNAVARRLGRFELADTGSIFLDEVGEMSPAMQAKLLRVLQEREFERVGGTETIRVDVRVIAATNQNLRQAVLDGAFREDLYYRLSVVPLFLPPLRERTRDIPLLCARFIDKYNEEFGKDVSGISPEAVKVLADYHWPGNIRELENAIERAVLLSRKDELTPDDFHLGMDPAEVMSLGIGSLHGGQDGGNDRDSDDCHNAVHEAPEPYIEIMGPDGNPLSLEEIEKRHISAVLEQCSWNRTQAAKFLDITRRTLLNKINKYDL